MRYIKLYEDFNRRMSIFDQDIKSLLPEEIRIETSYGKYEFERKDIMLNGDLIQIVYHQNTPNSMQMETLLQTESQIIFV